MFGNDYKKRLVRIALYIIIGVMVPVVTFPYVWTFICSIKPSTELFTKSTQLHTLKPTLENYIELFNHTHFPIFLKNTAIVCFGSVLLSLVVSVLGGYSSARFEYKGRKVLAYAILFSYMLPQILIAIPMFLIFSRLKLVNTHIGLIIAMTANICPFCMWLLWGFFKSIPYEIEESALIDGAGHVRAFIFVVLPLALPGIIAASIFAFTLSWNNYTFPLILTTSEDMKLITTGLTRFATARGTQWGLVDAGTIIATMPGLIFFWIIQRHLIRGWGAGGVKG
jgi:ABC-type glycerol-3-phosphate transport system permease component